MTTQTITPEYVRAFHVRWPRQPSGRASVVSWIDTYRIHGSNEPETIGQAVSSGCFRMTNDDVIDLYNRVVGPTVIVK
jgi:lipoprotein-anchoring transpeptidase ErfK/SrfK